MSEENKTQDEAIVQAPKPIVPTADKDIPQVPESDNDVPTLPEVQSGTAEKEVGHVGTGAEEDPVVIDDDEGFEILDDDDDEEEEDEDEEEDEEAAKKARQAALKAFYNATPDQLDELEKEEDDYTDDENEVSKPTEKAPEPEVTTGTKRSAPEDESVKPSNTETEIGAGADIEDSTEQEDGPSEAKKAKVD